MMGQSVNEKSLITHSAILEEHRSVMDVRKDGQTDRQRYDTTFCTFIQFRAVNYYNAM